MTRRMLAASALLLVSVSCRDAPTLPAATADSGAQPDPDPVVASDGLTDFRELIDDPLVLLLIGSIDSSSEGLQSTFQELSRATEALDEPAIRHALKEAQSGAKGELEEEDAVLYGALRFVLEHAETALNSAQLADLDDDDERGEETYRNLVNDE